MKISADRTLAVRKHVRVAQTSPDVAVVKTGIVRGRGRAAVVVLVANRSGKPLADLPVSVGVRRGGGKVVLLNGGRNVPYFQTHIPSVAGNGKTTWVLPVARAGRAGG